MSVVIAVAATFTASGLLAGITGLVLRKHPAASLVVAILGTIVAAATAATLIGALVVFGTSTSIWPLIVTDYFLATAHHIVNGPYPFFWTPHWIYQVGSLTPLIVLGAFLALRAGSAVRRSAPRAALVIVVLACGLLAAYVVAGIYAAASTWGGIPL